MARIISIDQPPRHPLWWKLVVAAALLVIAVASLSLAVRSEPPGPRVPPVAVRQVVERPVAVQAAVVESGRAGASVAARTLPQCAYQAIDVSRSDGPVERQCMLPTKLVQNGSLRTYVLEPHGASEWSLRLDTDGHSVMRAQWSAPGKPAYRCEPSCRGVSFGPRDARGVRTLKVVDLALGTATDENSPVGAHKTVVLRASLIIRSDAEHPSLACTGPSVAVVESAGGVLQFCASDGTGFARLDDGLLRFEMRGSEGDVLLVELDDAGAIQQVRWGDLRCVRDACSGASTQASASGSVDSGRSFHFAGVTLFAAADQRRSATLNGSIVLP